MRGRPAQRRPPVARARSGYGQNCHSPDQTRPDPTLGPAIHRNRPAGPRGVCICPRRPSRLVSPQREERGGYIPPETAISPYHPEVLYWTLPSDAPLRETRTVTWMCWVQHLALVYLSPPAIFQALWNYCIAEKNEKEQPSSFTRVLR